MYVYKSEIRSGPLLEVKYYKSFRKRDKKSIARGYNRFKTKEQQKSANRIRAEQHTQRLILCNFTVGDWFARFSAPGEKFSEAEFERIVANFFKRIKRRAEKQHIQFKYIGYCECGKSGKNWHLHIVIEDCVRKIATECWRWANGINLTPLYKNGNFADLAAYIRKDVSGQKRLKTSRNLKKPEIKVVDAKKREFKKIERGEAIEVPQGYYLIHDDMFVNEVSGASYHFEFMRLDAFERKRKFNARKG